MNEAPSYNIVMVIDDNDVDRYIATTYIKKNNFASRVITKDCAGDALDYLREYASKPKELPQLIFLDIRMPDMSGFDFLREFELLSDIVKENCTIMMLSTSLNPDDHEKAMNNKYVNKILNKPLDREKLNSLKPNFQENK